MALFMLSYPKVIFVNLLRFGFGVMKMKDYSRVVQLHNIHVKITDTFTNSVSMLVKMKVTIAACENRCIGPHCLASQINTL
jgi:hypothetical protein